MNNATTNYKSMAGKKSGVRVAAGLQAVHNAKQVYDLKPIDHTTQKKFKPHPNNYARFREHIPKGA